ncbi:hypothetical protein LshimejAT787_1001500 [Lyophyllum shimeji]|uniref:Uncharacterized protein n=1 Tax=Lyophyllum shimeji TaxID=47721 RepID=A0A9P3PRS2_LYOSH|nr:hypothetical protein LshimejAT787_1001500 [Lyophyllum shimeji]
MTASSSYSVCRLWDFITGKVRRDQETGVNATLPRRSGMPPRRPETSSYRLLSTYDMKFFAPIVSALAFLGAASAQSTYIGYPADGTTVKQGEQIVVQVVRPNSIQGSIEVGMVIGLQACEYPGSPGCYPPNQAVGNVLYNGRYDPVLHEMPGRPYENFTVTIPTGDYFVGKTQLSVDRFHLIGAGPAAALEFHNITLNVVA